MPAGSLSLDHVAHYVRDVDEAPRSLEALGFTVTPPSAQTTHFDCLLWVTQSGHPVTIKQAAQKCRTAY
jgi:hypothetical protein